MPVIRYRAGRGVDLRTPVMIRYALCNSASILWAWPDLSHTGAQYSAVEWHSARAVCLKVFGSAPHFVVASLLSRLFLEASLPLSLVI